MINPELRVYQCVIYRDTGSASIIAFQRSYFLYLITSLLLLSPVSVSLPDKRPRIYEHVYNNRFALLISLLFLLIK